MEMAKAIEKQITANPANPHQNIHSILLVIKKHQGINFLLYLRWVSLARYYGNCKSYRKKITANSANPPQNLLSVLLIIEKHQGIIFYCICGGLAKWSAVEMAKAIEKKSRLTQLTHTKTDCLYY